MTEVKRQRSFLKLGLPASPPVADAALYNEFVKIYNAIGTLATAIDCLQPKVAVTYKEAVALGNLVNLYDDGSGVLCARNAIASDSTKFCCGYCPDNDVAIGDTGEVIILGIHPFIAADGVTRGKRYFLSTTAGRFSSSSPATSGSIIQPIGIAIDDSTLFINPSLYYAII